MISSMANMCISAYPSVCNTVLRDCKTELEEIGKQVEECLNLKVKETKAGEDRAFAADLAKLNFELTPPKLTPQVLPNREYTE